MFLMCAEAQQSATIQQSQTLLDQIIADSQKHAFHRTTDSGHPLRLAESLAASVAGDLSEYNDLMVEIIARWAKAGEFAEAEYLADNLPSCGPARAHLEIAWVLFRNGNREKAAEHLKRSLETMDQARGRKAEVLRTRYCELLYSLDRVAEARSMESRLSELARLELDARLQRLQLNPALDLAQAAAGGQGHGAQGCRNRARGQGGVHHDAPARAAVQVHQAAIDQAIVRRLASGWRLGWAAAKVAAASSFSRASTEQVANDPSTEGSCQPTNTTVRVPSGGPARVP